MENTPDPILGKSQDRQDYIVEAGSVGSVIFLLAFMGLTPFALFGIHDFIMKKSKRGLIHIYAFIAVAILMAMMGTTPFFLSRTYTQQEIQTIMDGFETAAIIVVLCSYLLSIAETITYIRLIKEHPELVKIMEPSTEEYEGYDYDEEDEDEEEEEGDDDDDEEDEENPELKITP